MTKWFLCSLQDLSLTIHELSEESNDSDEKMMITFGEDDSN